MWGLTHDPVSTAKFTMIKDRQTGTTVSGIVKESCILSEVKLIKCTEIKTTSVYLQNVHGVHNLLCIQPNKWEVDLIAV